MAFYKFEKCDESGKTMIETILYISIMMMIMLMFVGIVSAAMDKYKINKISQQISLLRKNISARYMAEGSYIRMNNDTLIKEKVVPTEMINGSDFYHPYKGLVEIVGTEDDYSITLYDLPKRICVDVATLDWRVDETTTLKTVAISPNSEGSGVTYGWQSDSNDTTLPISVSVAETVCDDSSKNKIILTFE